MSLLQIGVIHNFDLQNNVYNLKSATDKWKCIVNIDFFFFFFLVYLEKFDDCVEDPLNNYDTGNGT